LGVSGLEDTRQLEFTFAEDSQSSLDNLEPKEVAAKGRNALTASDTPDKKD